MVRGSRDSVWREASGCELKWGRGRGGTVTRITRHRGWGDVSTPEEDRTGTEVQTGGGVCQFSPRGVGGT